MNGQIIAASAGITQLRRVIDLINQGATAEQVLQWCLAQIVVREEILVAETTGIPRQRKIRPRQARAVVCPTGKVPWRSQRDADRALDETKAKRAGECRHYRCHHCHYWHLTSIPAAMEKKGTENECNEHRAC